MEKYELSLEDLVEIAEHVADNLQHLRGKESLMSLEVERFCLIKGYPKVCKPGT